MKEYRNKNAEVFDMVKDGEVICVTTNGFVKANGGCVMGRGIARQVRDMFPGIDIRLGGYIKKYGNRCFNLADVTMNGKKFRLVSFPVKHIWSDQADINLIIKSCGELMELADKYGYKKIYLPAPGCGNGRLNYEHEVKPWIENLLDDRVVCVRR